MDRVGVTGVLWAVFFQSGVGVIHGGVSIDRYFI